MKSRSAFATSAPARAGAPALDAGLRGYMVRVFTWMAAALGVTGATALAVAASPDMIALIWGSPLKWVALFAPLGVVLLFSAAINRLSFATAQAVYWGFAVLMGISLSSLFVAYTGGSIARAFFGSAAMFLGAALWGYSTKRDLTSFGSFLFMGVIGLVIASVINIFLGSTAIQWAVSLVAVGVFTGLTAWDAQRLKEIYDERMSGDELGKTALMGALSLYLNMVNIFTSLLNLTGQRN